MGIRFFRGLTPLLKAGSAMALPYFFMPPTRRIVLQVTYKIRIAFFQLLFQQYGCQFSKNGSQKTASARSIHLAVFHLSSAI